MCFSSILTRARELWFEERCSESEKHTALLLYYPLPGIDKVVAMGKWQASDWEQG